MGAAESMKKINKVLICTNMSGYLPMLIDLLDKNNIQIAGVMLMSKRYYQNNKLFFDRMILAGLSIDSFAYLKNKPYRTYVINDINSNSAFEIIENINPDLIINNGMMYSYGEKILNKFRVLNTHSGLLPFYRGRCGASWAIYNGEREHGVTCHLMSKDLDLGPIVAQSVIKIRKTDYVKDILLQEKEIVPFLVMESIRKLNSGKFIPKKQCKSEGSFFPILHSEIDGIIDWRKDLTVNIYNKIRAFSFPYAGAFISKNGFKIVLSNARLPEKNTFISSEPGLVFGVTKDRGIRVTTIDGFLIIEKALTPLGGESCAADLLMLGEYLYKK